MTKDERAEFWAQVETGSNPLLSVMSNLVEKWGMPAIMMALGDISVVLSEDAVDADNITADQRGLIINCCAQVSNLSDLMHAEMDFIKSRHD